MTDAKQNRRPDLPAGEVPEGGRIEAPRRTILQESWSLFKKNRLAMAGMGSVFMRYKSPALVNLNFAPTFTPPLLKKDLDLGLDAADRTGTALPLTALTREIVQSLIGRGHVDDDFATLLVQQADSSGLKLKSENVEVDDGLH